MASEHLQMECDWNDDADQIPEETSHERRYEFEAWYRNRNGNRDDGKKDTEEYPQTPSKEPGLVESIRLQ